MNLFAKQKILTRLNKIYCYQREKVGGNLGDLY